MIDFHSHILPGMDDGSQCVRDSLEMLRQDRICVLGTDTHNLSTRAPRMDAAMAYMEKRMGTGYCESLERRAYDFLKDRSHG